MRIAFKICIETLSGAQALPRLLAMLDEHKVQVSFAVSLGLPKESAGGVKGLLRRLGGASDTIAEVAQENLLAIQKAGHEIGMAAYDVAAWETQAATATEAWTRQQFGKGWAAFDALYHEAPAFHSAPNWQLNPHLLTLEEERKLGFASDTRGKTVFYPQLQAVRSSCPQIPTTLPTIDEALNRAEVTLDNVHEFILADSQRLYPHGEVFSFNAEPEWLPIFEKLIVMWKGLQWDMMPMGKLLASNNPEGFRVHQIGWGQVPDSADNLVIQSLPVEVD